MNRRAKGVLKINPIILIGALGLILIPIIMFMLGQSPQSAANDFMAALAKGNVDKLTEMSYLPDPERPLKEQWKETFDLYAKDYVYGWEMGSTQKMGSDRAVVKVTIVEFRGPEMHENDTVNLPLVKKDGEWKVDIRDLTRTFFPGLPR
jgi:hypothetical protein